MNLISTISNEGSVHFMTYKETMTAALFITFLERMLSETTRKIFLIVDRLRAHEAKKVEAWAAEHRDRIELLPRQPRSAQILTADSVQQQPIAAPEGSEINHGIHRNITSARKLLTNRSYGVSYHLCSG